MDKYWMYMCAVDRWLMLVKITFLFHINLTGFSMFYKKIILWKKNYTGVVLTAAHCVDKKEPQILKIRAGEWDTVCISTLLFLPHEIISILNYVKKNSSKQKMKFSRIKIVKCAIMSFIQNITVVDCITILLYYSLHHQLKSLRM